MENYCMFKHIVTHFLDHVVTPHVSELISMEHTYRRHTRAQYTTLLKLHPLPASFPHAKWHTYKEAALAISTAALRHQRG